MSTATLAQPLRDVSGPDLLEATAGWLASNRAPAVNGLHVAFRMVAAEAISQAVDHSTLATLADMLIDALGEYLICVIGQHEHRTLRRTVAGWLIDVSPVELRDELVRAAAWWRAELTGRWSR